MHPRRYETLVMLAPNLPADSFDSFKNKIDGILSEGSAKIVRFEDWGRRRLAYPVQKELYGYYLLYDFQGSPALSAELERNLKIDERVFKYLTLVLDKKFTDEALEKAKEALLAEAARREAEKNKPIDADEEDASEDEQDEMEDEITDGEDDE